MKCSAWRQPIYRITQSYDGIKTAIGFKIIAEGIMQFDKAKTYLNLVRNFTGESQAGIHYQLVARAATAQGYITLADIIKTLTKNETHHARRFFEELNKREVYLENIVKRGVSLSRRRY